MPSARRTPHPTTLSLVLLALVLSVLALGPAPAQAAPILKLADPDTSRGWVDLFGDGSGPLSYSTGQSGRIWADKSVFGSAEEARAAGLPISLEDDEHGFIVSLSALSSATSFRHEGGPAHDVVLVVPLNRLLVDRTYDGRAQAAHLADALNAAIARLTAENDDGSTPTRVSVIGYSSDVTTLMPLSSYEPDDQGRYVSNRVSWYVDGDHGMVAGDGLPYRFARTDEVDAIANGTWEQADASVRSRVEAARAAGATAVCETYFYIGNLENQYTGGDAALYDFAVMVETDLSDGRQTLLLSAPVEAVPARRASVTVHEDGSATMVLEDSGDAWPVRLVYEVRPTAPVEALLERIEAGGTVSDEELAQATGADVAQTASGGRLLYASAFDGDGASSEAGSAWVAPGNSYYSFAHDAPLFSLKDGQTLPASGLPAADQLEPLATRPVPGATYYYAKTIYDATLIAPGEAEPATQRTVFLPYVAPDEASQEGRLAQGPDGQWLALAGTLKHLVPVELGSHEKVTNVTGSAPYAERLSIEQTRDDGIHLQARLGNNGLLVLPPQTGSAELVVEKSLDGGRHELTDSERAQTFAFDVSLSRAGGAPLEAPVLLTGPSGEAELVTPEGGRLELSLADGQSARISGIPAGTSFSVSERPVPGFSPTITVEPADGGSSSGDDAATGTLAIGTTTARFTNTKQVGTLVVGKTVAGNAADQARAFPFDVTLDRDGRRGRLRHARGGA